jgi:hypothetical protein
LCHEMCHVAAWIVDRVSKPPHGEVFKKWAARAMAKYPQLNITTCHSYEITYKYQYQCLNSWCGKIYGRQSKSIDTSKSGCGVCGAHLHLIPKLKIDGTPAKTKTPSKFALFVKANFASVKAINSTLDHKGIMSKLSELYAQQQSAATDSLAEQFDALALPAY